MQDSAIFISRLEELSNFYEIYGEKKQELFEVPWRKNPIIIDVGAHIGVYSIKNALKFPEGKVIAIEPEKNNYNALTLNKRLNMLQNLLPYNLALSDKSGKLKLYLDELGSGQHSIIAKTDNFEEVKTKTMDDFIKDIKLKNIDLIKIDVEGAEYKVLQGAKGIIKKYYPTFVIELHPWNTPRIDKKIENLLSSYGYNLVEFKGEFIIFAYK
jgi:FkbM family methyltransferase